MMDKLALLVCFASLWAISTAPSRGCGEWRFKLAVLYVEPTIDSRNGRVRTGSLFPLVRAHAMECYAR